VVRDLHRFHVPIWVMGMGTGTYQVICGPVDQPVDQP